MPKEIIFQKKNGVPVPFRPEDLEAWGEYRENQVTRHLVSGTKKERSWQQLKMLYGCMKTVCENTDHPRWNTLEKTKFSLKVALHFVVEGLVAVDPQGNVHFQYRSFGYDDLGHMEACKLFERAWPILADVIGISVEELLAEAKTREGL